MRNREANESWFWFHYRLWHDVFDQPVNFFFWLVSALGPQIVDLMTPSSMPWYLKTLWFLLVTMLWCGYGVGRVVQNLERQIDASRPRFVMDVLWHCRGMWNGSDVIVAGFRVQNLGHDSQAEHWRARLRESGVLLKKGSLPSSDPQIRLKSGGRVLRLKRKEHITKKLWNGLGNGERAYGYAIYHLDGEEPLSSDVLSYTFNAVRSGDVVEARCSWLSKQEPVGNVELSAEITNG